MVSLLGWLGKQVEGAVAQINPWDNGATYNSVMKRRDEEERRRQQQPQQRPQPTFQRGSQTNSQPNYQHNTQPNRPGIGLLSATQPQNDPRRTGLVANDIMQKMNSLSGKPKDISPETWQKMTPKARTNIIENERKLKNSQNAIADPGHVVGDVVNGIGGFLFNNAAKLANTANEGVIAPVSKLVSGQDPHKVQAETNKKLFTDKGGLLNAGTFFPTQEHYRETTKNPINFAKGFTGAGLATASETVPFARGASLLANPALKTSQKIVRGGLEGGAYGSGYVAGDQMANQQDLDLLEIAKGGGLGLGLGVAIPAAVPAAKLATKGAKVAAREVNNTRPSVIARQDPRVVGYDENIARMQQQFDAEPNQLVRHQLNKAIAIARQEQAATYNQVLGQTKRAQEGGFVAGPLAGDFKKAEAEGKVFDGVDGKPRFEVDDSGAKLNTQTISKAAQAQKTGTAKLKLDEALDHPELYKQYPELKDVEVTFVGNGGLENGRWSKSIDGKDELIINSNRTLEEQKGTILHEVQHGIQSREGFATGTSPGAARVKGDYEQSLKNYENSAGEAEARAVQKRMNMTEGERYVTDKTKAGDYVGSHQAPTRGDGDYHAPASDVTGGAGMFPDDIYTDPQAYRYYGHGGDAKTIAMDKKSVELIRALKDNPDAEVTMYRAVPKGKADKVNPGDWVTLNRDYAQMHNSSQFDGKGTILEQKVKADELYTDGNSIHEFGYDPRPQPRSTFYDSLDVPKKDLIIRNDGGTAMSIDPKKAPQVGKTNLAGLARENPNFYDFKARAKEQGVKLSESKLKAEFWRTHVNDDIRALKNFGADESKLNPNVDPRKSLQDYRDFVTARQDVLKKLDPSYKPIDVNKIKTPLEIRIDEQVLQKFGRQDKSKASQATKKPTLRDALDGKSTKIIGEAVDTPKVSQQRRQTVAPQQGVATATSAAKSETNINSSFPFAKDSTTKVKVKQATSRDKQVPLRQMVKDGDTVTATNVNKDVKAREKRYTVDKDGELIEDKKGATSLFTNKDGTVKGFRVGKEYFDKKDLGNLESVNGYGSTVATMRRNIERAFDKETGDKVNKFLVDHQQSQATKLIDRQVKLKQGMKELTDDLGISFGVGSRKAKKVSAAIQDFGEKARTRKSLIDEFGEPTANKIVKADKWFRKQYDDMLTEMNTTLEQFGYDPVPKRKNYYTHFQDENLWKRFGLKMQEIRDLSSPTMQDASPTAARGSISNKLAGLSEQTAPNKAFNKFALQRKGDKHTSDAFKSFEAYMNPTLNNIYMTPSIARARALSRAIAQDADIVGKDANKTIVQLREWGNNLAGKSNRFDRPLLDTTWGSRTIKAFGWAQKKAGQNTIVGNLSTAVLQPVVLAQTAGKFGYKNTLLGMTDVLNPSKKSALKNSEFMRRRYSDLSPVTSTKMDRARKVANKPLETVEQASAEITWHAAHNDALSKGLTGKKAIQYADVGTEKTLAGRSIGERPELYRSKAAGPFTMYQLEVNNYWQQMGKEFTKKEAAKALVAAYGLNLMFNEVIGRDVGFNPISAAIDVYDESQKEGKSIGEKIKSSGQRVAGEVADNVPIVPQVATTLFGDKNYKKVVGDESQGGRFGVSSPLSTLISNPEYIVSPFGGSQVKKTIKAAKGLIDGKLTNKDDETTVNIPQNPGNIAKGLLFGQSAIPEVNQYYNNLGKKKVDQSLVKNQTDSIAANQGKDADSSAGLTNEGVKGLLKKNKERSIKFKESLSDDDYAISQLSRKDQQKLVDSGDISQGKLDGLRNYVKNKKKELGYEDDGDGKYSKDLPNNLSTSAKSILEAADKVEKRDDKWKSTKAKDQSIREELKKWLPNKVDMPEVTNEVALDWAKYQKDFAAGKVTKLEADTKKKGILMDAFNHQLNKDERKLYRMSKAKLQAAYDNGFINDKNIENALKIEQQMYDAGLIEKRPLAKKLGLGGGGTSTSKGGRKTGGRKGKGGSKGNRVTIGKALNSLTSSLNKLQPPKTTGGASKPNTKPQMKQVALKKYTVAGTKVSSRPVKITSRKARA